MTITDRDMRNQVKAALGTFADEHDVDGIVTEIQQTYGTVDTETIGHDVFWALVERHPKS